MVIFRKVVLPLLYLIVLAGIAVALLLMAVGPATESAEADVEATGSMPDTDATVQRGDIDATLSFSGQVLADPPSDVKASAAGTVSYVYVGSGQTVNKGERLFQLKYPLEEKSADADKDDEDGPKTGETAYGYADIVAPKNGITGTYRVSQGGNVDKGTVVTQVRSTQYRVQASVDPVQLYVLDPLPKQAEVTIPRGPEPFECKYLRLTEAEAAASNVKNGGGQTGSDSDADGDDSGDEQNQATLTCTVPKNVRVFHGLQADVKVSTGKAKNVLLVPVTAVQGLGDNGTVWVPDKSGDGKEKAVTLGRSDGTNIEVKKGLKEGDSILEYVPGTEPEDDSGGFSEMDGMSSSGEM